MEERDDLYRILEVAPDADAQSIDEAYWRLAVRYDSSGEETFEEGETSEDARMMDRVARAYEVLSDPQRRADYDRMGKRHPRGGVRRSRIPRLPAGTLDSLGRTLASAPGAVPRLLKRLLTPWRSRRMALIAGLAAVVAAGLVVGFVYQPDFGGGGEGPGAYSLGGPGVSAAAVGPAPAQTPARERTPTPTPTTGPTSTPLVSQGAALDTDPASADIASADILEALGQVEGRLRLVESRLDSLLDASRKGVSVGPSPTPTRAPTPTPTPAPTTTPTPAPVDPGQLDWIQRHQHEHGELPAIPGWLAPLVENAGEGDTVEGQRVLIPTAEQWCHLLRPSDRLRLLEYVTWLGYHYEDWVWEVGRAIGDDWLSRCPPAGSY